MRSAMRTAGYLPVRMRMQGRQVGCTLINGACVQNLVQKLVAGLGQPQQYMQAP